jgi:hypothetical protein
VGVFSCLGPDAPRPKPALGIPSQRGALQQRSWSRGDDGLIAFLRTSVVIGVRRLQWAASGFINSLGPHRTMIMSAFACAGRGHGGHVAVMACVNASFCDGR